MLLLTLVSMFVCNVPYLTAYSNPGYSLTNFSEAIFGDTCVQKRPESHIVDVAYLDNNNFYDNKRLKANEKKTKKIEPDPIDVFEKTLHLLLFGPKSTEGTGGKAATTRKPMLLHQNQKYPQIDMEDILGHYPSGSIFRHIINTNIAAYAAPHVTIQPRNPHHKLCMVSLETNCMVFVGDHSHSNSELFRGRPMVHLPPFEFMHVGHCFLNRSSDAMQTAVDAFAIYIRGSTRDVRRLPPDYVLNSARTIAMMRLPNEKLNATWEVVKRGRKPVEVRHWELEMYRPLFKYLNGREIARLNLTDPRILTYIGTHSDLDRHQVGVIASRYMRLNPDWTQPQYLNLMNNLLCGVPMTYMRKIGSHVYLQLTHQLFYHIRACDPLQRRFYLAMMSRTDALGKAYSWSARDVARLGLLLGEVEGPDLASVVPEAMSGLTAQVMLDMPAHTLQYITDEQVKYLGVKSLAILARKLSQYRAEQRTLNHADNLSARFTLVLTITCLVYARNKQV